jgi:hypothetical protein
VRSVAATAKASVSAVDSRAFALDEDQVGGATRRALALRLVASRRAPILNWWARKSSNSGASDEAARVLARRRRAGARGHVSRDLEAYVCPEMHVVG